MYRISREVLLFGKGRKQNLIRLLFSAVACLSLGACGDSQTAFFYGADRSQSVSLVREQLYLSGPWKTLLIVGTDSQCQRRYELEGLSGDQLLIDVYLPEPGVYILAADKRWYVTELKGCAFQAYKVAPPQPGQLVGSFRTDGQSLSFHEKKTGQPSSSSISTTQK